jgi:hypothetical protein
VPLTQLHQLSAAVAPETNNPDLLHGWLFIHSYE